MARRLRHWIVALVVACVASALPLPAESDDYDLVRAGPVHYAIPKIYRAESDGNGLFLQLALPEWIPLKKNQPGWADNVNILVNRQPAPIAQIYDLHWDGAPTGSLTPSKRIERIYRLKSEFTVQEMGSGYDIVIPDQDRNTFPLGIMRCNRPRLLKGYAPSCALLFDRDGQRWEITFGREFLSRYREFRERATHLLDSFREEHNR